MLHNIQGQEFELNQIIRRKIIINYKEKDFYGHMNQKVELLLNLGKSTRRVLLSSADLVLSR